MSQENVEIVRRYFQLIDRMLGEYWVNPVPLASTPRLNRRSEMYMLMRSGNRLTWRPFGPGCVAGCGLRLA